MIISGRYFAVAYKTGPLALTVRRLSEPGEIVEGTVVNGGWRGLFTDSSVVISKTDQEVEFDLVWQGDELPEGEREDYGFGYVLEQLENGYQLS